MEHVPLGSRWPASIRHSRSNTYLRHHNSDTHFAGPVIHARHSMIVRTPVSRQPEQEHTSPSLLLMGELLLSVQVTSA